MSAHLSILASPLPFPEVKQEELVPGQWYWWIAFDLPTGSYHQLSVVWCGLDEFGTVVVTGYRNDLEDNDCLIYDAGVNLVGQFYGPVPCPVLLQHDRSAHQRPA